MFTRHRRREGNSATLLARKPHLREPKTYFVYIMSNLSKTLYTGVTNNLVRRVREHRTGTASGFAAKYRLDRLVYFLSASRMYTMRLNVKNESRAGCGSRRLR